MAGFDFVNYVIRMGGSDCGGRYATTAECVNALPQDCDATAVFIHEDIHFLHVMSTVPALNWLGSVVDIAVEAALRIIGVLSDSSEDGKAPDELDVLGILQQQGAHDILARPEHRYFRDKLRPFIGQMHVQFKAGGPSDLVDRVLHAWDCTYPGNASYKSVVTQRVFWSDFDQDLSGVVLPPLPDSRPQFFPFNHRFLGENVARRVDTWYRRSCGLEEVNDGPLWRENDVLYNGVLRLIEFRAGITEPDVQAERLAVALASLSLLCRRPHQALEALLAHEGVSSFSNSGRRVEDIACELRDMLVARELLSRPIYREGWAKFFSVFRADQREPINRYISRVLALAECIYSDPLYFARVEVNWADVQEWAESFSIPPVVAAAPDTDPSQGKPVPVDSVGGLISDDGLRNLLSCVFPILLSINDIID